ncbi:coiled-coil domain-containing protein 103 [Protopterus annectens]|uniref:coiled-coil domain-containing protein 103 n=1 Tax=Protopterus annectens TaxID=7888 RepID=UPI001CFB499D|nr:coiled-coil domain-containing protein 103 [Protopterus annectens]XP_043911049.1 coiled-coil domain-containing protein 103 [Protopterus annectens]XP_043911050.1 coiled-coil domain-containing protein 103 [Protopterus annectens]XP_043911051.1 coiled-coil domain-containing protein 103 [Protopterus annectens]
MDEPETIDFVALERELQAVLAADEKYRRENDAKFRAIHQKVASYEEFRDIVLASHLKPLERKDKLGGKKHQPWNSFALPAKQQDNSDSEILEGSAYLPQTAADFYREWRRKAESGVEKYSLLLKIGGEQLGKIFSAEIGFGLLGEFLMVLSENFCSDDQEEVLKILNSFTSTGRFGLNVDFLSTSEKQSCAKLFQRLQSMSCNSNTSNSDACVHTSSCASADSLQSDKAEEQSTDDFICGNEVRDFRLQELMHLYMVM